MASIPGARSRFAMRAVGDYYCRIRALIFGVFVGAGLLALGFAGYYLFRTGVRNGKFIGRIVCLAPGRGRWFAIIRRLPGLR